MTSRTMCNVVSLCFAITCLPYPTFGAIIQVDQQSPFLAGNAAIAIVGNITYQTFTPTFDRIDAMEFRIWAPDSPSTVSASVFDGASVLPGDLLGSAPSQIVTSTDGTNIVHFDLTTSVSLTPGNTYTIAFLPESGGSAWFGINHSNPYPGGEFEGSSSQDLEFLEGIHIPEPTTLALTMFGMAGLGWCRRTRI